MLMIVASDKDNRETQQWLGGKTVEIQNIFQIVSWAILDTKQGWVDTR